MYQIFGLKRFLTGFAILVGVIAIPFVFFGDQQDIRAWFGAISKAATIGGVLVWFFGQTPIFPMVCRLPVLRNVFPDIDGEWVGENHSNWPTIAQRSGLDVPPNGGITRVGVTFKARLLTVTMRLASETRYSEFKTIFVKVARDEDHGDVRLWYLYENSTKKPETTDSERHFGGAYVDIQQRAGETELDGSWKNRNWEKGLNTAGRIVLRRPK